ncbi:putative amino group acetyl transferase [Vibrio parahaemolyticus VP2007-007]|nr:putative amino group acetyl transferase [Vibrio parahaemolyticus VP2007-007]
MNIESDNELLDAFYVVTTQKILRKPISSSIATSSMAF